MSILVPYLETVYVTKTNNKTQKSLPELTLGSFENMHYFSGEIWILIGLIVVINKIVVVWLKEINFATVQINSCVKHCAKCVLIWSFSGPCFTLFGQNTEIYSVDVRIPPKQREIWT